MLYVPFWILVILHGPHFWKWFVAPGAMFILEKIFRSKLIKLARYGETFVEEVNLLPSGVSFEYSILLLCSPSSSSSSSSSLLPYDINDLLLLRHHNMTSPKPKRLRSGIGVKSDIHFFHHLRQVKPFLFYTLQ